MRVSTSCPPLIILYTYADVREHALSYTTRGMFREKLTREHDLNNKIVVRLERDKPEYRSCTRTNVLLGSVRDKYDPAPSCMCTASAVKCTKIDSRTIGIRTYSRRYTLYKCTDWSADPDRPFSP